MSAVLEILWYITLGSLLTAGVIILIRILFRNILSAKAKYYLWLLLALRLLLPSLPGSPTSLMNLIPAKAESQQLMMVETADSTAPTDTEPLYLGPGSPADPALEIEIDRQVNPENGTEVVTAWAFCWDDVIVVLWGIGVAVTLLVFIILYLLTGRNLKKLPYCTDPDTLRLFVELRKALGIRREIRLVSGSGGMSGGLLHPTIVVPAEQHGEDLKPILLHELMHIRAKDLWLMAFYRLLCALNWFNPIVWLCFHRANLDSEAACDQRVLETGLVEKSDYAEVLYRESLLKSADGLYFRTAFGGGKHAIRDRIRQISLFAGKKTWMVPLVLVLAVVVSACTLTGKESKESSESVLAQNSSATMEFIFEDYIAPLQPPGGIYGLTLQEHYNLGLLNPDNGTISTNEQDGITFTQFATIIELGGYEVDAVYSFGQNLFSEEEVLTQVFVTPPENVDLEEWINGFNATWSKHMMQSNTDPNSEYRWYTSLTVGHMLDEEQQAYAANRLLELGQAESEVNAINNLFSWVMATNFYIAEANLWQFNGTGIALVQCASDSASPAALPIITDSTQSSLLDIPWDSTPDEVMARLSLDSDSTLLSETSSGATMTALSPLPDHPEITKMEFRFNNIDDVPCLRGINISYDREIITFDELVAQRTDDLGAPTANEAQQAEWFDLEHTTLVVSDEFTLNEYVRKIGPLNTQMLSLEEICGDSSISAEKITALLASVSGMAWEEYETLLLHAIESGDYSQVLISLVGKPCYYVIHRSPDESRVRAIRLVLVDDSQDEEGWLSYTETTSKILSDSCTEAQSATRYIFNEGQVLVEHGPVNSEDYTVHEDGTSGYAGVIGTLGDRILEFSFTFEN